MIDVLACGRLVGKPQQRTTKAGGLFATFRLRVATRGDEAVFVSAICFKSEAVQALLAMDDGNALSVSGEGTLKTWTDKAGVTKPQLDLLVHAVLSEFHVQRKRRAVAEAAQPKREHEFDDELPDNMAGRRA